jgi:hypothetical protein
MRPDEPRRDVAGLSYLRGVHAGEPIAVLGAGPGLPADLERLPAGAILIGVNHHAIKLGINLDYVAFLDDPRKIPGLRELVFSFRALGRLISPLSAWSSFELVNVPDFGLTATFATWIAAKIGGGSIYLCGFDCYQTGAVYCDGSKIPPHPVHDYPLEMHLDVWRRARPHFGDARIRAVSGPLVEVFGGID